jgi:hypothetical protein
MFLARSIAARPSFVLHARRCVFIQTVENPNKDSLMFYPQVKLLEGGSVDFPSIKAAAKSPLARLLFALDGVTGVYITEEFVTINKRSDVSWNVLKPAAFETLMDFFASGRPVIEEGIFYFFFSFSFFFFFLFKGAPLRKDTAIHEDDDETVILIKCSYISLKIICFVFIFRFVFAAIIDEHIRPGVAQDGGDVEYVGFSQGVVMVRMQGSCSGCPSSSATLKNGIQVCCCLFVCFLL